MESDSSAQSTGLPEAKDDYRRGGGSGGVRPTSSGADASRLRCLDAGRLPGAVRRKPRLLAGAFRGGCPVLSSRRPPRPRQDRARVVLLGGDGRAAFDKIGDSVSEVPPERQAAATETGSVVWTSRNSGPGSDTIAGHFPEAVRRQLRMIGAQEGRTIQLLLAEILHDLFHKPGQLSMAQE